MNVCTIVMEMWEYFCAKIAEILVKLMYILSMLCYFRNRVTTII